jgi:hypothetical protein
MPGQTYAIIYLAYIVYRFDHGEDECFLRAVA